jgi:hypothetical protein
MTKEELKQALDEKGVEYDGRWSEEKLESLLNGDEELLEDDQPEVVQSEPVNGLTVKRSNLKYNKQTLTVGDVWPQGASEELTASLLEKGIIG